MSRMLQTLAAAFSLSVGLSAFAAEPQTIELRNGRYWEPVKNPTTAPVTDEALDRVGEILQNGNPGAAKSLALSWIKRHPGKDTPLRDRALYLLGSANYLVGERIEAFYNFDELMDFYPDSKYFYPALDKQYQIADAFLSGYKNKFLGMAILSAEDESIEMLYRIQGRSPGSPLAERALKRTADFYYADAQYDLAADAYQAYIERYKRSPELPQVKLKKAFALLAQFKGTKFDPTPVINARAALEEVQSESPDLARQENVAAVIERIDSSLARKSYQTAQFYIRTHEPKSAAFYFRYIINTYPNSPEAGKSKEDLTKLPKWALDAPAPATQPVSMQLNSK